jgi:hypothetical protein
MGANSLPRAQLGIPRLLMELAEATAARAARTMETRIVEIGSVGCGSNDEKRGAATVALWVIAKQHRHFSSFRGTGSLAGNNGMDREPAEASASAEADKGSDQTEQLNC